MKKLVLISILLLPFSCPALADIATPISAEECLKSAPIIVLAQEGKVELDDLKEGAVLNSTLREFYSRKQTFKILKVYRNNSGAQLKPGREISVNQTANFCDDFNVKIRKVSGKLQIIPATGPAQEPFFVETHKGAQKVVLFLNRSFYTGGLLRYYDPSGSPQTFSKKLETALALEPEYKPSEFTEPEINFRMSPIRNIGNIAPYRKDLLARISANWKTKISATEKTQLPVLELEISKDGKLNSCKILESAGKKADNDSLKAVQETKFAALPVWFHGNKLTFKIEMAKVNALQH